MFCSLTRWQLSNALDHPRQRSQRLESHLARCSDCRRFAETLDDLHGRLTLEVSAAPAPSRRVVSRRARAARPLIAGAMIATAAAVALLYVSLRPSARDESRPDVSAETKRTQPTASREASGAGATVAAVSTRPSARALLADASRLMTATPLRSELAALEADTARGALALLDLGGIQHWLE